MDDGQRSIRRIENLRKSLHDQINQTLVSIHIRSLNNRIVHNKVHKSRVCSMFKAELPGISSPLPTPAVKWRGSYVVGQNKLKAIMNILAST